MEYNTTIQLDTRRKKQRGVYPVKLRVYSINDKKAKLYATKYDLSTRDFESIWQTEKPRKEYKTLRNEIQAIELRADEICKTIKPFNFEEFERQFFRAKGDGSDVVYHYAEVIDKLKGDKRFGTASNYTLSLQSLKAFIQHSKGSEPNTIPFKTITPDWLNKYEAYMTNDLKRKHTTVGIYLRPLRAIFNKAIHEKAILSDLYPFGVKKYKIPAGSNTKKALSSDELATLFHAESNIPEQVKARDFWFFSFACNGMNVKDILQLKYANLKGDTLEFVRAKTIRTSKTDLKTVTVYLNDFAKSIIKKYGSNDKQKDNYIFPVFDKGMSEQTKHGKTKNFTKFINQNLKKLAENAGLSNDISTYWARHSFATASIRKGQSMEFVMEALSHNNLSTTKSYFAGFEDKTKREFMNTLMDF